MSITADKGAVFIDTTGIVSLGTPVQAEQVVNLRDYILISSTVIDRQYIKGTLTPLDKASFSISNLSSDYNINVSLQELSGIHFSPKTFDLAKRTSQPVELTFDSTIIDQLPTGINTLTIAVTLSSKDAVITIPTPAPEPPIVIPPVVAPPTTFVPPSPTDSPTYIPTPGQGGNQATPPDPMPTIPPPTTFSGGTNDPNANTFIPVAPPNQTGGNNTGGGGNIGGGVGSGQFTFI